MQFMIYGKDEKIIITNIFLTNIPMIYGTTFFIIVLIEYYFRHMVNNIYLINQGNNIATNRLVLSIKNVYKKFSTQPSMSVGIFVYT